MKKMLVGTEKEYGIRCNFAELLRKENGQWGYAAAIVKQVSRVLPPENFAEVRENVSEFWTAGGMRVYVDHGTHVEMSTPECATFADLAFQERVGDRLVQACIESARAVFASSAHNYFGPLVLYANNTAADAADPTKDVTFSHHENYLLRRDLLVERSLGISLFRYLFIHAGLFFVMRPVIGGAGYITPGGTFLLSPRADWAEREVDGATTASRPVVNTRDEPHADGEIFLRYHYILGDTNITSRVLKMKMAFSYWVLRLIERGWTAPPGFSGAENALFKFSHSVNRDASLCERYALSSRRSLSAAEILLQYLEAVDAHRELIEFEAEDSGIFADIAAYLSRASAGPEGLVGESEWATKYALIREKCAKNGWTSYNHAPLKKLSIELHNCDEDPERNPFAQARRDLFSLDEKIPSLARATRTAPKTRAFLRGLAVFLWKKHANSGEFMNLLSWTSVRFRTEEVCCGDYGVFILNQKAPWECARADVARLVTHVKHVFRGHGRRQTKNAHSASPPASAGEASG